MASERQKAIAEQLQREAQLAELQNINETMQAVVEAIRIFSERIDGFEAYLKNIENTSTEKPKKKRK